MSEFSILGLETHFNPTGWGPRNGEPLQAFKDIPYAHFDKKERTWRSADFSLLGQAFNQKTTYSNRYTKKDDMSSSNADFVYRHDAVEDQSFQLVDTSKLQNKKFTTSNFYDFYVKYIFFKYI